MTGCLTFVPSGGLANRMRAIASACQLCRTTDSRLHVVWFQGWGMHAAYSDIFEPLTSEGVQLREATLTDYILNDRPRRHNLWMPWLPQQVAYRGGVIQERAVAQMRDAGFDFEGWLRGRHRYMSCYDEFGTFPDASYSQLFRPCRAVQDKMDALCAPFGSYTIGMHIRRTDNVDSITQSPTELFIDAAHRELEQHPDLVIFLATDSEQVKTDLRQVFGRRLLTSDHAASRDSVEGIRDGLADMWALSRTARIYGSAGSSFSVMASKIGGVELLLCQR